MNLGYYVEFIVIIVSSLYNSILLCVVVTRHKWGPGEEFSCVVWHDEKVLMSPPQKLVIILLTWCLMLYEPPEYFLWYDLHIHFISLCCDIISYCCTLVKVSRAVSSDYFNVFFFLSFACAVSATNSLDWYKLVLHSNLYDNPSIMWDKEQTLECHYCSQFKVVSSCQQESHVQLF